MLKISDILITCPGGASPAAACQRCNRHIIPGNQRFSTSKLQWLGSLTKCKRLKQIFVSMETTLMICVMKTAIQF